MEVKIKLHTIANASLFVAKCGLFNEDIDYVNGHKFVDAKSLVGVISSGVEQICIARMHTDNESVFEEFKHNIKLWIVED